MCIVVIYNDFLVFNYRRHGSFSKYLSIEIKRMLLLSALNPCHFLQFISHTQHCVYQSFRSFKMHYIHLYIYTEIYLNSIILCSDVFYFPLVYVLEIFTGLYIYIHIDLICFLNSSLVP